MSTPPLPAGYALDQPQTVPPLPTGYKLDSTQEPGVLDKEIPLTSYKNATMQGVQSIGRGLAGAASGAVKMFAPPQTTGENVAVGLGGPIGVAAYRGVAGLGQSLGGASQVPAAIKDINASSDPTGTYAKAAQETAGQGAGQALLALGSEGAIRAAGAIRNPIPSTARAGAAFQDLKATVGDVPISTAKVGDSALELYTQSQRGATLPPAVNKLVRRLSQPDSPPMTYAEAKDFQSNISNLSANERMNLKPNQVRLVGQLNQDLKAALRDAADTAGKGQQFTQAMRDYHNAMKIRGYTDTAISSAWKLALGALGVHEAAKFFGITPGQ